MVKFFQYSPAKELGLTQHADFLGPKGPQVKSDLPNQMERHVAFTTFIEMSPVILETLEDYSTKLNTSKEEVASAAYLRKVSAFDFVVTLVIVNKCWSYLSSLNRSLLEKTLDVAKALSHSNIGKHLFEGQQD